MCSRNVGLGDTLNNNYYEHTRRSQMGNPQHLGLAKDTRHVGGRVT